MDDWELLLALHHHEREWDGMISNDTGMLDQPRELAVLGYTHLTLVAPQAAGHDPIRSTGLVLANIEDIAERTTTKRPQIWKLNRRQHGGDHPDRYFEKLAKRRGEDPMDLRRESAPDLEILAKDPLAQRSGIG